MPELPNDGLPHGAADGSTPTDAGDRKPFVAPVVEDLGGLTDLTELGGSIP